VSPHQLRKVMAFTTGKVNAFAEPLSALVREFFITTSKRRAHCTTRVAHESGELRWPPRAASGEGNEGRPTLGNTSPCDGARFLTRAPPQSYQRHEGCAADALRRRVPGTMSNVPVRILAGSA
jgi:hypothetical protein